MGTEQVAYDELEKQLRRTSRLFFWSIFLWPVLVGWLLALPLAVQLFALARRPLGSRWAQRMTVAGVTALVAGIAPLIWYRLSAHLNGYEATARYPATLPGTVVGALIVAGVGFYAWAHLEVARHHRLPSLEHWWAKVLAPVWSAVTAIVLIAVMTFAPFGMSDQFADSIAGWAVVPGLIAGLWMLTRLIWAHDWLLEDLEAASQGQPSVTA